MIRLYCDWNIFVGFKSGHLSELSELLKNSKHRIRTFYSTAHIGDIYKSYSQEVGFSDVIRSDLATLSLFTNNNCFLQTKDGVVPETRDPIKLFEDRIYSEEVHQRMIGHLNSNDDSDPLFSLFFNLIPAFPIGLDLSEDQKDQLSSFLPGLDENVTMKGMAQSILSMFNDLHQTDRYKGLREVFQKGFAINRDRIYNSSSPFQDLDTIFREANIPENSFQEFIEKLNALKREEPKSWFDQITHTYINLDMAGYKEDVIKVTEKQKDTFKNTIEDAFHVSFASQCDFYVTNDKRNYFKAKAVYERLEVNTRVFYPNEFLHHLSELLHEDLTQSFLQLVVSKIKNSTPYSWENEQGSISYVYFFEDFVLDYFNKVYWINDAADEEDYNQWMIILTKEKPTNGRFTLFDDIQMLIAKLIHLFGIPKDNKLFLTDSEIGSIQESLNWDGREWIIGDLRIKFSSLNGYFQLYLQPETKEFVDD